MSTQAVLFDAPGPKARRRYLIGTGIGLLLVAVIAWLVIGKFVQKDQFTADKWTPFVSGEAWSQYLVPGIVSTLEAAAISIVLALVFGLLFGLGRLSQLAPIRWVCGVVVEFFRAVPVLLMMFFFFGIFTQNNIFPSELNPLAAVVTGLTLYNGSVIAELVRSGVHSLPRGQSEAGLSIGLTPNQTMRSIQLPQALTAMLPALMGQLVVVLKDSALGTAITYVELLSQGKTLGTAFANTVPAMMVVAVIFIIMNNVLTQLAGRLERRLNKRGRPTIAGSGAGNLTDGSGLAGGTVRVTGATDQTVAL